MDQLSPTGQCLLRMLHLDWYDRFRSFNFRHIPDDDLAHSAASQACLELARYADARELDYDEFRACQADSFFWRRNKWCLMNALRRLKKDVLAKAAALAGEAAMPESNGSVRAQDMLLDVRDAFDKLDPPDQQVLRLRTVEGATWEMVAANLGVSKPTAVTRWRAAAERLRRRLT